MKSGRIPLPIRWLISLSLVLVCFVSTGWTQTDLGTGFREPAEAMITTDDGTVALSWNDKGEGWEYEVRRWMEGSDESGVLVYQGPDSGTFLSGLPEGVFELKLRAAREGDAFPDWPSSGLEVTVDYIDMHLVVGLMSAGFVTFLAILGTIFFGHIRQREGVVESLETNS